jgi:hypothetical protein
MSISTLLFFAEIYRMKRLSFLYPSIGLERTTTFTHLFFAKAGATDPFHLAILQKP